MSHSKTHIARVLGVMSLLVSLLAFGGSALSSVASAAPKPQPCAVNAAGYAGTMGISGNPATASPGTVITITGVGFPPNSTVPLFVKGSTGGGTTKVGTVVTNAAGGFTFAWTVPMTATVGETFTFTANCGSVKKGTTIAVSAVTVGTTLPGSTQPLPSTGSSNTIPLLGTGISLVVIGGLILLALRKRTARSAHAA